MSSDPKDASEATPGAHPSTAADTSYSPSSERETEVLQDDPEDSPALRGIDRSKVKVLPGTGDYTDDGDVEVDESELHIPRHPDRDSVAPVAAEGEPGGSDTEA